MSLDEVERILISLRTQIRLRSESYLAMGAADLEVVARLFRRMVGKR